MKRVTILLALVTTAFGLVGVGAPAAGAATETCQAYNNIEGVNPFTASEGPDTRILMNLQWASCTLGDGHFYKRWRLAVRQGVTRSDLDDIAVGLKTTQGDDCTTSGAVSAGTWHVPLADNTSWVSPSFRFSLTGTGRWVFADMHVTYDIEDGFNGTGCWSKI